MIDQTNPGSFFFHLQIWKILCFWWILVYNNSFFFFSFLSSIFSVCHHHHHHHFLSETQKMIIFNIWNYFHSLLDSFQSLRYSICISCLFLVPYTPKSSFKYNYPLVCKFRIHFLSVFQFPYFQSLYKMVINYNHWTQ